MTPLELACKNNRIDFVMLLIVSGASLTPIMDVFYPALYWASTKGSVDIVKILLSQIQLHNKTYMTDMAAENDSDIYKQYVKLLCQLVMQTISKGHTEIVQLLLDYIISINTVGNDDICIQSEWNDWLSAYLFAACEHGHVSIARLLLERGADVNRIGSDDMHILHYMLSKHETICIEMLKFFFEYNVNVDVVCPERGNTVLLKACDILFTECIHALLAYGADVNLANRNGVTPLMHACAAQDMALIRMLLEYGADVTMTNKGGLTAVDLFGKSERSIALRALCEEYREANSKRGYVCK